MLGFIKMLPALINSSYQGYISNLPGEQGFHLRYQFWRKRLGYLGKNVRIDTNVYFQQPRFIFVQDETWIDKNVVILAGIDDSQRECIQSGRAESDDKLGKVYIGKQVHVSVGVILSGISGGLSIGNGSCIAASSKIYALTHHYRSRLNPTNKKFHFSSMVEERYQCLIRGSIHIGNNVGIAVNAVLLPGTYIGDNSFVKMNSIVSNGHFGENSLIDGNPATCVSKRFKNGDKEII